MVDEECAEVRRGHLCMPLIGLVLLSPASLDAARIPLAPPGSIEPKELVAAVRVSHRHRAIVECIPVPKRVSCVGRVAEADTGAIVRFERMGVITVGLSPAQGAVRVVFSHQAGPQEQVIRVIRLAVGPWLVDWPESERLERLETSAELCRSCADECRRMAGGLQLCLA
jgi:hypothetical protein